jgi:hypothetical protein
LQLMQPTGKVPDIAELLMWGKGRKTVVISTG